MTKPDGAVACHWLAPTRIMPHPFCFAADARPWTCLRDGRPRPLNAAELSQCATCPRWEPRTLDASKRDLAFETWGVGIPLPAERTFDDGRRDVAWNTWGVRTD
jgi:hypothetical protein